MAIVLHEHPRARENVLRCERERSIQGGPTHGTALRAAPRALAPVRLPAHLQYSQNCAACASKGAAA